MDNPGTRFDAKLLIAVGLVVLYHGALLPYTLPNTYDSYIHMFFADHYARSWFDPWEPRWYTGFATTSYPPGSHMATALLMNFLPLTAAFISVFVFALAVLVLGIYRFSLLWVSRDAAGYAAIASVFASSIVETVHVFGQLPTIFSLGIFLNGLPHVYRWLATGRWSQLLIVVIYGAATTAAHHVTTIFGTVFFIGPMGLHAWAAHLEMRAEDIARLRGIRKLVLLGLPAFRGVLLGILLVAVIATTVFPYWYWSVTDPITQVPIPHGSRESFIARPDLGLVFFVIPWGAFIFLLPYITWKTFTTRLWPLGLSVLFCFVLGTGGTTPVPRMILGGAFDILTLDRFTFWATILALPFVGHLVDSLLSGRLRQVLIAAFGHRMVMFSVIGLFGAVIGFATFVASLSSFRPMQPDFIDPAPIVKFMSEDDHEKWRYLTLGFGDQFAFLSAQMTAQSVDGNYHSARRLPDLTRFAVERLENSKYLGVPGLGSLKQFLVNAEDYNLKFIFSNDAFYDPLLYFTGWNRLYRLRNGVVVWEKPDIAPLPVVQPRRNLPRVHKIMWAILPPSALLICYLVLFSTIALRGAGHGSGDFRQLLERSPVRSDYTKLRKAVQFIAVIVVLALAAAGAMVVRAKLRPMTPSEVITAYYTHLDFRRPLSAYALLSPDAMKVDDYLLQLRWTGGLVASYSKLLNVSSKTLSENEGTRVEDVELSILTPFGLRTVQRLVELDKVDGRWTIRPDFETRPVPPERLLRQADTSWHAAGRRQAEGEDLHRDIMDRPNLRIEDARLVRHDGRYSAIVLVSHQDSDPANVKVRANLYGKEGNELAHRYTAETADYRLMPGEIGAYSIEFDGVLDLEAARRDGAFDPEVFIPPVFASAPENMSVSVDALVSTAIPYRGLALTGIHHASMHDGLVVNATATNTGTGQAEVIRFHLTLFDLDGRIIWSQTRFADEDLKPGQSAPISMKLPHSASLEVVADADHERTMVNGLNEPGSGLGTRLRTLPGFVPLPEDTGYAGFILSTESMTFEPLF